MADIRARVQEDQGILKKIQMFVPGFRGYRKREDIRDADRMLRAQIATKLGLQRKGLEESRSLLVQGGSIKELDLIGGIISQFKKMEGKVAHSEGGYSGLVSDITVHEAEMNQLYEYDASLIDHINAMSVSVDALKSSIVAADEPTMHKELMSMKARIGDFETQFNRRLVVMTGTEV